MKKNDQRKPQDKFKTGLKFLAPVLSVSIAVTAVAAANDATPWKIPFAGIGETEVTYATNYFPLGMQNFALSDVENAELIAEVEEATKEVMDEQSTECADPDKPGSLGQVQKKGMEDARKLDTVGINIDNIFKIGKSGGCFSALGNFPDLSGSIPSLTDIFNSIKDTLVKYATRKVCNVVNEALEEALDPIQSAMEDLSDGGSLDLSGRLNRDVTKRLYDIDPELGRVSKPADAADEFEIGW